MTNMNNSGMGFGGFLLGLGVGWYIFSYIDASINIISYILILMGAGMVINALLSKGRSRSPLQGIFGGIVGGLFLALFITQGFTIFESIGEEFGNLGSNYRAQDTSTFTGDVSLDKMFIEVDNRNGGLSLETWDQPGYRIDLTLRAKGATDVQAAENLDRLQVLFSGESVGDTLRLSLGTQAPGDNWSLYAVEIDIKVPEDPSLDLDLETSNGEIALIDVTGGEIVVHTSNGRLTLDRVYADSITGTTSNGQITGEVEAASVELSTSNGSIDLTIPATVSGDYTLDTSNGSINLELPKTTTIGYKVDLSTSIGTVNVDLPNLSYTTNDARRKVGSTSGYEGKAVKVIVTAETSIGSISIY